MAYFPHAYKKVFVGTQFVTTGKMEDLTAGQFGFFNPKTWTAISVANANVTANPQVMLAVGSYHTSDKVGVTGGYKESVKSPIIIANKIRRYWRRIATNAVAHSMLLGHDGSSDDTSPQFFCGQTYRLRIDVKGSPALRYLGHNLYRVFSVSTPCCANPSSPVAVDPFTVMLEFAKQINADPLFSPLISASLWDTSIGMVDADTYVPLTDLSDIAVAQASLMLTAIMQDTVFSDCSFDPRDAFNDEPLLITSAQLIDDSGRPCSAFKQLAFNEAQPPFLAQGSGEELLRELILSNSYRQERYQFDARRRDIENMSTFPVVRGNSYDSYFILYNVPRKLNPSGVHDEDLYQLRLSAPVGTMATFRSWMNTYLGSAGTGVVMETL